MRPTKCPTPVRSKLLVNRKTNQLLPLACKRWSCAVCGPAKAYKLGCQAALCNPERWVMLSDTSDGVRGAYKALTGLSRSLRRRGYSWEYLAVPERNPSGNGRFHLHLMQKGSFIPQAELSELAERAGMGRYVWIQKIDRYEESHQKTAKYLVKYMTKDPDGHPPNVKRYAASKGFWGLGGKKGFDEAWASPAKGDWGVVHQGAAEIRGEDGTILWMGAAKGGVL